MVTARALPLFLPDQPWRAGGVGAALVPQAAFPGGSEVEADGSGDAFPAHSLPRHGPANRNGWTPVGSAMPDFGTRQ
jgi:hypothetical protein